MQSLKQDQFPIKISEDVRKKFWAKFMLLIDSLKKNEEFRCKLPPGFSVFFL